MDVHRRHSIEVVGSDGTILVPSPWQTPAGTEILLMRDETERITPEPVDPYGRELDEVGAAIAEGRAPRLGREESLAQARVIQALYRAAADGVVVSL
jgi:predicted dehydrogenase